MSADKQLKNYNLEFCPYQIKSGGRIFSMTV